MNVVIPIEIGVSGHYTLHKGKVDVAGIPIPGTHKKVAEFDNLITDNGLDKVFQCPGTSGIQTLFPNCYVGTGSTPPAFTDSSLASYLAGGGITSAITSFVDDATHPYWKIVKVWRFNAGTATGNLTEVGTGWTNINLFSRALILDGGGSPTTITVLSDEYLDVTYECRNYLDVNTYTTTITISGVPYDVSYRPFDIDTVPNWGRAISEAVNLPNLSLLETQTLATVYNTPAGTLGGSPSLAFSTYVTGNFYIDMTFTWGLTSSNFTLGVGAGILNTTICKFQMNFTPRIPKDATKILTISLRLSWARYP